MQIIKIFKVQVEHRERMPLENGRGFTTRPLPSTQEEVTVTVDFEAIAKALGPRACASKGGKAVECGGFVVVKRANPAKQPPAQND